MSDPNDAGVFYHSAFILVISYINGLTPELQEIFFVLTNFLQIDTTCYALTVYVG